MYNSNTRTKDLVLTSLMIALVFIAAMVIKIPTVGGFVHLGDCMVFLSVIVLGKKRGAFASAVGMALVDIISGYTIWAPFTFIIKWGMAYIAGSIIEKFGHMEEDRVIKKEEIIAFVVSGVFMVIAYFFAGAIIAAFLTDKLGLIQGLALAAKDIVTNIIQVSVGIIIAVPLSFILVSAKNKVIRS